MPSVSAKQHRTMQAAAHNPEFAKKVGIPVSVAKEFTDADKAEGKYQKKRTEMKESITQLVRQISAGDNEGAAVSFQNILASKVTARLEDMKVDVANQYFNGANESVELEESTDEALDEAFDGTAVTINKPGHSAHGKEAKVFHRHEDGRVNVQVRSRVGTAHKINNYTLKPGEFSEKK